MPRACGKVRYDPAKTIDTGDDLPLVEDLLTWKPHPKCVSAIERDDSTLSAGKMRQRRFTGAQPGSGHLTAGLSWNERTATSNNR